MRTLVYGGRLIDPANSVDGELNLLLEGGKVALVTRERPNADKVIDAGGKIVCPGFVDMHMHEDPVEPEGKIYADEEKAIFNCMLRMGVTTAIGGNCGQNCCDPGDYLDLADRQGLAVNVGMLAGHEYFRKKAGAMDKYGPTDEKQRKTMAGDIAAALERGCLGVSYGIRYIPGIDMEELKATAAPCAGKNKIIAAHLRSDAEEVFTAAREFMDAGRALDLPVQISHIGSMAGFGQMARFLAMADEYRMNGLDLGCDCYPYSAFSTALGSTTYDEGWLDRYHCGYEVVELCEGDDKGKRCTEEIFRKVRRENPECITVCHVMKDADIELALRHPNVALASDGIMNHGQGHPRAAGSFPRLFAEYVRRGRLSLYEAVNKVTAMPAKRMGLESKGRLNAGADADVVIFDANKIADRAVFPSPLLSPAGIDYVLIGGELAARDCRIVRKDLGRSVRRF